MQSVNPRSRRASDLDARSQHDIAASREPYSAPRPASRFPYVLLSVGLASLLSLASFMLLDANTATTRSTLAQVNASLALAQDTVSKLRAENKKLTQELDAAAKETERYRKAAILLDEICEDPPAELRRQCRARE